MKSRLREDAPAVLYGCGDLKLLDTGGLAVVGSRHVDEKLVEYTVSVGRLTADAGKKIVSGGAKGIDQAAMRGALEAGGKVCGVLANGLEKGAMSREYRKWLLDRRLVLISPYDPGAGFNVGNAMQRNKLIYTLADCSLVVSSDLEKGGTWTGAVEQLEKLKLIPVFVRSNGDTSDGLKGLRKRGALAWPEPHDADSFEEVFNVELPSELASHQTELPLIPIDETSPKKEDSPKSLTVGLEDIPNIYRRIGKADTDEQTKNSVSEPLAQSELSSQKTSGENMGLVQAEKSPAEVVFAAVRSAMQQILTSPAKDSDVALALDVSKSKAKKWLEQLVDEGLVEKQTRPVRYIYKEKLLVD